MLRPQRILHLATCHPTYTGRSTEGFRIEPGAPLGDWVSDFTVCGNPAVDTEPAVVVLAPEESCDAWIRVHSHGLSDRRAGSYRVTARGTLRTREVELQDFNRA